MATYAPRVLREPMPLATWHTHADSVINIIAERARREREREQYLQPLYIEAPEPRKER